MRIYLILPIYLRTQLRHHLAHTPQLQKNSSISTELIPYLASATASTTYGTITSLYTKQATLTRSTTLLGIGSSITALNYANVTDSPNLSQYAL
jgi:hypothetical protein